jgi:hypothetical protein
VERQGGWADRESCVNAAGEPLLFAVLTRVVTSCTSIRAGTPLTPRFEIGAISQQTQKLGL